MDLETHMRDQLRLMLVQRAIFCPVSGEVMDVRTCITINDVDDDPEVVLSPAGWDALVAGDGALPQRLADAGHSVTDPRAVPAPDGGDD